MAKSFNLTAELNLRGPSNITTVVAGIRRQLGSITANVDLKINPTTTRNVAQLTAGLRALNTTLNSTTTSATSAANAIAALSRSVNSVNIKNLPSQVTATNTALSKLSSLSHSSQSALQGATTEMQEFGKQAGLAVRRFTAFSASAGVIFGLTNAINRGVQAFITYDKEFVKLQQVTGQTSAGLKDLSDEITRLSTAFGVSSTELADVSSTLAQAGLSARDTEKALKALALSSLAPSFDDMNSTVEGSIALMRQFGISAAELDKALSSINSVAAKFAVEASDIITAIQRTGGVFATASKGVSQGTDALNEFISVFTSVRATTRESAETIATGLRTIFTRIQRTGTIDALKEFGVNLQDAQGKFVGAYKAVELLSQGLNKIDPRDLKFSKIVEELGGFRQIGKVIPLIQQFAVAQDALKVAQRGQGSLAKDAVTAQLSLANQISKVREEFLALFREIGSSKTFQTLTSGAISLASALIKITDSLKGVLPALAIIGAVKGVSALGQFATGFGTAIKGQKKSQGGSIMHFARGGMVPGQGDGDTVPAMLMPGEFVIRKKAVQAIGVNKLQSINRYASGGFVQKNKLSELPSMDSLYRRNKNIQPYDEVQSYITPINLTPTEADFKKYWWEGIKKQKQLTAQMSKEYGKNIPRYISNRGSSDFSGSSDLRSDQWYKGNAFQEFIEDQLGKYGVKATSYDDPELDFFAALDFNFGDAKFVNAAKVAKYSTPNTDQTREILSKRLRQTVQDTTLDWNPLKDRKKLSNTSVFLPDPGTKEILDAWYSKQVKQSNEVSTGQIARSEFPGGLYNAGGLIQKLGVGGGVKELAQSTGLSIEEVILQKIQELGDIKGVKNLLKFSNGDRTLDGLLRAGNIRSGKNLPKVIDYIDEAMGVARDSGVVQANAIKAATKVGLVGLLPIGYSKEFGPEQLGNKSVYMVARGLGNQYEDIVNNLQQESEALSNKYAQQIQHRSIFGNPNSTDVRHGLVFDFDDTLVSGADILGPDGKPNIPEYSNRTAVTAHLQNGRLTSLGNKLKQLISADPSFINQTRILTARPQSTVDLLSNSLQKLGLPYSANMITGVSQGLGTDIGAEKTKNLAAYEKLIDDNLDTIKKATKAGKSAFHYREPEQLSSSVSMVTGQANIEGAMIEKILASLGAPLKEDARQNRAVDYPDGLGAAAQYFPGIGADWPTEVKRTIDGNSLFKAREEFTRLFSSKFASGGQVSAKEKAIAQYKRILSSVLPKEMLSSEGFLRMPDGGSEPIDIIPGTGLSASQLEIILGRFVGSGSYYKGTLKFQTMRHNLEASKNTLSPIEYGTLKEFIDKNIEGMGNKDIISTKNSRHKGILAHETFHDIQGFLYDNHPEIIDKLQTSLDKRKNQVAAWYNDPQSEAWRGRGQYKLNNFFPSKDSDSPYASYTTEDAGNFVTDKLRTSFVPQNISKILSKSQQDLGRNELIPVLMSAAAAGNPGATSLLSEVFAESGLKSDFYKTLPKFALGGLADETASMQNLISGLYGNRSPQTKPSKEYGKISLAEDGNQISVGYLKNNTRSGYANAYKMRDYLYYIGLSSATNGYGPRLYDVLMEAVSEKGAMLTSDRSMVSGDARKVWEYYFKNRPDVKKTPLKPGDWTLNQSLIDPKLYGKEDTWPPATDPAWILQSGYSKSPALLNSSDIIRFNKTSDPRLVADSYFASKRGYAAGGSIEDTVPALLTPGEFVINKKAAQRIGYSQLHKLNNADRLQGYNKGGVVDTPYKFAAGGTTPFVDRQNAAIDTMISGSSITPFTLLTTSIGKLSSKIIPTVATINDAATVMGKMAFETGRVQAASIVGKVSLKQLVDAMEKDYVRAVASGSYSTKELAKAEAIVTTARDIEARATQKLANQKSAMAQVQQDNLKPRGFLDVTRSPLLTSEKGLIGLSAGLGVLSTNTDKLYGKNVDENIARKNARASSATSISSQGLAATSQFATKIAPMLDALAPGVGKTTTAFLALGSVTLGVIDYFTDFSGHTQKAVDEFNKALRDKELEQASDRVQKAFGELATASNKNAALMAASQAVQSQVRFGIRNNVKDFQSQYRDELNNREYVGNAGVEKVGMGNYLSRLLSDKFGQGTTYLKSNALIASETAEQFANNPNAINTASMAKSLLKEKIQNGQSINQLSGGADFNSAVDAIMATKTKFYMLNSAASKLTQAQKDAELTELRKATINELLNNEELKAVERSKQLADAMNAVDRAGRRLATNITNLTEALSQSIEKLNFQATSSAEATKVFVDALSGSARIGKYDSVAGNVLSNPKAYSNDEYRTAVSSTAGMLGNTEDSRTLGNLSVLGQELKNSTTSAVSSVLKQSASAGLDVLDPAAKKAGIQNIKSFNFPPELEQSLIQELSGTIDNIRTNIEGDKSLQANPAEAAKVFRDKLAEDTSSLVQHNDAINKALQAINEFRTSAFNRYAEALNDAAQKQLEASKLFTEAKDIIRSNNIELRKVITGVGPSFNGTLYDQNNKVATLTGGITDPEKIKNQILLNGKKLEELQQKRNASTNNNETKALTDQMNALSSTTNKLNSALKLMSDNTELAARAMDRIQQANDNIAKKGSYIEKLLTQTPEEAYKFNQTLSKLQDYMNGVVRGPSRAAQKAGYDAFERSGSTYEAKKAMAGQMAQERGQALQAFNEYSDLQRGRLKDQQALATQQFNSKDPAAIQQMLQARGLTDDQIEEQLRGQKARMFQSMGAEAGMGNNPMLQQYIAETMNPMANASIRLGSQEYNAATSRQAGAVTAQAELAQNAGLTAANQAAQTLADSLNKLSTVFSQARMTDLTIQAGNAQILSKGSVQIVSQPQTQTNLPAVNPPAVPQGKQSGGLIYAAKGQLVDYQPQGTDTIPAMLTKGEFVVNAQSTAKNLPLLQAINKSRGGIVYLANGGMPTAPGAQPSYKQTLSLRDIYNLAKKEYEDYSKDGSNRDRASSYIAIVDNLHRIAPQLYGKGGSDEITVDTLAGMPDDGYKYWLDNLEYNAQEQEKTGRKNTPVIKQPPTPAQRVAGVPSAPQNASSGQGQQSQWTYAPGTTFMGIPVVNPYQQGAINNITAPATGNKPGFPSANVSFMNPYAQAPMAGRNRKYIPTQSRFTYLDKDKDGYLNDKEISKDLLKDFDKDQDGFISPSEFEIGERNQKLRKLSLMSIPSGKRTADQEARLQRIKDNEDSVLTPEQRKAIQAQTDKRERILSLGKSIAQAKTNAENARIAKLQAKYEELKKDDPSLSIGRFIFEENGIRQADGKPLLSAKDEAGLEAKMAADEQSARDKASSDRERKKFAEDLQAAQARQEAADRKAAREAEWAASQEATRRVLKDKGPVTPSPELQALRDAADKAAADAESSHAAFKDKWGTDVPSFKPGTKDRGTLASSASRQAKANQQLQEFLKTNPGDKQIAEFKVQQRLYPNLSAEALGERARARVDSDVSYQYRQQGLPQPQKEVKVDERLMDFAIFGDSSGESSDKLGETLAASYYDAINNGSIEPIAAFGNTRQEKSIVKITPIRGLVGTINENKTWSNLAFRLNPLSALFPESAPSYRVKYSDGSETTLMSGGPDSNALLQQFMAIQGLKDLAEARALAQQRQLQAEALKRATGTTTINPSKQIMTQGYAGIKPSVINNLPDTQALEWLGGAPEQLSSLPSIRSGGAYPMIQGSIPPAAPTAPAQSLLSRMFSSQNFPTFSKIPDALKTLKDNINIPWKGLGKALGTGSTVYAATRLANQSNQNEETKKPKAKASGGLIYASTGKYVNFEPRGTDTIPAMLSPGEFVVNARSTSKHLPLLQSINKSSGGIIKPKYYTDAGLVEDFSTLGKGLADFWRYTTGTQKKIEHEDTTGAVGSGLNLTGSGLKIISELPKLIEGVSGASTPDILNRISHGAHQYAPGVNLFGDIISGIGYGQHLADSHTSVADKTKSGVSLGQKTISAIANIGQMSGLKNILGFNLGRSSAAATVGAEVINGAITGLNDKKGIATGYGPVARMVLGAITGNSNTDNASGDISRGGIYSTIAAVAGGATSMGAILPLALAGAGVAGVGYEAKLLAEMTGQTAGLMEDNQFRSPEIRRHSNNVSNSAFYLNGVPSDQKDLAYGTQGSLIAKYVSDEQMMDMAVRQAQQYLSSSDATATQPASTTDAPTIGLGSSNFKPMTTTSGVQARSNGGLIYASNGALMSAQSKGTDNVPAMLTSGEFVVNRSAAMKHMPLLNAINSGHYTAGGIVNYLASGGMVAPRYYAGAGPVNGMSGVSNSVNSIGGQDLVGQIQAIKQAMSEMNSFVPALENVSKSLSDGLKTGGETIMGAASSLLNSASELTNMPTQINITQNGRVDVAGIPQGLNDFGNSVLNSVPKIAENSSLETLRHNDKVTYEGSQNTMNLHSPMGGNQSRTV
jgi:TP901 family phage tail tape measure protein